MAEPFSIATGAIALAGTGITIAKALKAYINTVRKAEMRLRPVVRDVEVMSGVLTQIGTALENKAIRRGCTAHFFRIVKGALESCDENFQTLKGFNSGLMQIDGDEIRMTVSAKLSLYFKQQELDTLRDLMGESKASLNLVIGTLQIVITMRTAPKDSAAVEDLKLDMQNRIDELNREKANKGPKGISKGSDLDDFTSSSPRKAPSSLQSSAGTESNTKSIPPSAAVVAAEPAHSAAKDNKGSLRSSTRSGTPDRLITCLQDATRISSELRVEIFELIDLRKAGREYNSRQLHSTYDEAQAVFSALWTQERSTPDLQRPLTNSKPTKVATSDGSLSNLPSNRSLSDLGKRIVYTKITPLPSNVPRQLALDLLHEHKEIIRMNPHITGVRTIEPPSHAASGEYFSNWYEITKIITWGFKKRTSFNGCFHDQPWGMQSHILAPTNTDIRQTYRIGGNQPGEPREPREVGIDTPLDGLYLREDVSITCQVPLTARSVKKEIEDASAAIVKRLQRKIELLDEGKLHAMFEDGNLKTAKPSYWAPTFDQPPNKSGMRSGYTTYSYSNIASSGAGYGPSSGESTQRREDRHDLGAVPLGLDANAAESNRQDWPMEAVELPASVSDDDDSDPEVRKLASRARSEELQIEDRVPTRSGETPIGMTMPQSMKQERKTREEVRRQDELYVEQQRRLAARKRRTAAVGAAALGDGGRHLSKASSQYTPESQQAPLDHTRSSGGHPRVAEVGDESSGEEFEHVRRSSEEERHRSAAAAAPSVTAIDELLRNWTTLDI